LVLRADIIINKLIRIWLTAVLIYILFQYRFVQVSTALNNLDLSTFLNRIDELTVVVFLPIAFIKLLNRRDQYRLYFVLSIPIIGLISTGMASGFINGNPLKITLLGIFSYIKFFLLIFIYAAFFDKRDDMKRLYKIFLIISILLIFIALLQEVWALYSRYILDMDPVIPDTYLISYLFNKFGIPDIEEIGNWRFYLYRTPSMLSHYNLFGLFCLFVLSIYLFAYNKKDPFVIAFLTLGVLLSISRVAYTGLLFVMLARTFDKMKWRIILSIILISLTLLVVSLKTDTISEAEMQKRGSYLVRQNKLSFREYAMFISNQVWKDYPLLGAGPGMFGGDVAYKYNSPIYEEYNFYEVYREIRSLDQLWPQLLAEMGIIGGMAFAELIITIFVLLLIKERSDASGHGIPKALGVYTVVILFYTFGGNLNNPALLYPYCAFLGICLGSSKK